jgi:hypothetical protein
MALKSAANHADHGRNAEAAFTLTRALNAIGLAVHPIVEPADEKPADENEASR